MPDFPGREAVNDILEDIRDGITGGGEGGVSSLSEINDGIQDLLTLGQAGGASPAAGSQSLGSAISATGSWITWSGGKGAAFVTGTFGGSTVTLEARWSAGPAVSLGTAAVFTAAGGCLFELPVGAEIRMAIAGGSGISLTGVITHTGV